MAAESVKKSAKAANTPRIGEWKETDGRVELLATRCTACGEIFFPARKRCLRCGGDAMQPTALRGPARLTNFTVIHQPPSGFTAPLVAGYAEFASGVLVFAPIDAESDALKPGKTLLDVYVGPIRSYPNGDSLVAYRFRPSPGRGA
jgi:uncharacterized OB-fold protein